MVSFPSHMNWPKTTEIENNDVEMFVSLLCMEQQTIVHES